MLLDRAVVHASDPADAPGCGLASAGMVTKDREKKLVGCGLMDREREGDGGLKMKGRLWPDRESMAMVQIPLSLSMAVPEHGHDAKSSVSLIEADARVEANL